MQSIKDQIETYIKANGMRRTIERNILIDCVEHMKDFDIKKLLECAKLNAISKPSVYFFIELLVKIGIVKIQERYVFNFKTKSDENQKE